MYHVMTRGDHQEVIFGDDDDRNLFLATLAEGCEKNGFQIHSFCLLSNHLPLVVETPHVIFSAMVVGIAGDMCIVRPSKKNRLKRHRGGMYSNSQSHAAPMGLGRVAGRGVTINMSPLWGLAQAGAHMDRPNPAASEWGRENIMFSPQGVRPNQRADPCLPQVSRGQRDLKMAGGCRSNRGSNRSLVTPAASPRG